MEVFQDLINRGLKKVLMFISDDFKGISEAIKAYFPYSDILLLAATNEVK